MVKKVFFILIILVICCSTTVQAMSIKNIMEGADKFIQGGSTTESPITDASLKKMSDSIYNTLLVIGIVIAVIIGISLGIKFITGSVEQKSKIKETLIPYVAGCVVIFGAFGIWKMAVNIGKSIEDNQMTASQQGTNGKENISEMTITELKNEYEISGIAQNINNALQILIKEAPRLKININSTDEAVEILIGRWELYGDDEDKRAAEIWRRCLREKLLDDDLINLK